MNDTAVGATEQGAPRSLPALVAERQPWGAIVAFLLPAFTIYMALTAYPVTGDLVWSVPTLATLNPIGAPIAHAGLHVAPVDGELTPRHRVSPLTDLPHQGRPCGLDGRARVRGLAVAVVQGVVTGILVTLVFERVFLVRLP